MYYFCWKEIRKSKIIRKYEKKLVKLQRQLAHKEKKKSKLLQKSISKGMDMSCLWNKS